MRRRRRATATLFGVAAVVGLALTLRVPIADIPLERDEGEYGYIARRWLAGEPPYHSAFDQKPPGVFAAYAVILTVFGSSPAAIHWGAQVYTLGTLWLIYLVGRRLFGRAAGFAAALLAAYMTADRCVLGNAANTELFMILPLTAAFWAVIRASDGASASWATLGGACGALALLFKQVALSNVAVYALLLLGAERHRFRLVLVYALAALAALAMTIVYFAAAGVRDEFLDGVLLHNLDYANQVALYDYPRLFLTTFQRVALQWWPVLLLAIAASLRPAPAATRWEPRWLAAVWLLASFAGVAVGGYFRGHYYVQLIPPLAVLAGRGAILLAHRFGPSRPRVSALTVVAAVIAYGVLVVPGYWLTGSPVDKCRLLYDIAPFPEAAPVGNYLARQTGPEDTIFVYGNEPEIYFYSGRRAASRYIFLYPLLTPAPGVDARQAFALAELAERRPRYIVVHRYVYPPVGGSPPKDFEVSLADLLVRDYRQVGAVGPDDRAVHPVDGPAAGAEVLRPSVYETLAVWRRRDE